MSWVDTAKAAALAALTKRTAAAARIVSADAPWSWNPHDGWLTRVRQPREFVSPPSRSSPSSELER